MNSVIALSKIYSLNDPRVAQTMVRGELIIPTSDRIMTRSRAKQNPDRQKEMAKKLEEGKLSIRDWREQIQNVMNL